MVSPIGIIISHVAMCAVGIFFGWLKWGKGKKVLQAEVDQLKDKIKELV